MCLKKYAKRRKIYKMVKAFKILFILSVLCCGMIGCEKDKPDQFVVIGTTTTTMRSDTNWVDNDTLEQFIDINRHIDSLSGLQTSVFQDSFNNERGKTLFLNVGRNTYKLILPENLAQAGGQVLGNCRIEITILDKPGAFILGNKLTLSQQRLISVGAMVNLRIFRNSSPLRINASKSVNLEYMPRSRPSGNWQLFEVGSFGIGMRIDEWSPILNRPGNGISSRDSLVTLQFNEANKWYCAGNNVEGNGFTNRLSVTLPDSFSNKNTAVYAVQTYQNGTSSVVRLISISRERRFILPDFIRGFPVGTSVRVVAIAKIGSQNFWGDANVNLPITSTPTYLNKALNLTPVSQNSLLGFLNSL
jgi:hypothetical protein